jgi:GT2 family glycosyltransferase
MTMRDGAPLCVIPAFLRHERDADALLRCVVSLWSTRCGADVLVVDDGSPARQLLDPLATALAELGYELQATGRHRGVAAAANAGLSRARDEGRDAVLVHADVEFTDAGWLAALTRRTDSAGRPAAVAGARLLAASGDIHDAGRSFSELSRTWWARHRHAPADLPAALEPQASVVSGALALIRAHTLATVGLLDEDLRAGASDLDYCLRVFAAGLECVYEPAAVAVHHADPARYAGDERLERWTRDSEERFGRKWAGADLSPFVPEPL